MKNVSTTGEMTIPKFGKTRRAQQELQGRKGSAGSVLIGLPSVKLKKFECRVNSHNLDRLEFVAGSTAHRVCADSAQNHTVTSAADVANRDPTHIFDGIASTDLDP
jgi:hypothetical protein